MSEIKIEDYEQYWQKGGTYVLPIEIFNDLFYDIEQLQQENKNLREKLEKNTKIYLHTSKYASEMESKYIESNYILTEIEKWLEEDFKNEVEHPTPQIYCNCYSCKIRALDKLQELKGNINEKI